jgi:hypothetical protein
MLSFKKKEKSIFAVKDNRTFSQKVKDFGIMLLYCVIFWKGRKKGMIHTIDIRWSDIRAVFFPKDFGEKYRYLGTSVWREDSEYYKVLFPLVLALDYEAKPKWCPRWFLRFLHLFGSDNSIVRVRNRRLYNLERKLTKGIAFVDWKTKWTSYDLRISIHAPAHLQDLAQWIERGFYKDGREKELVDQIKAIDPNASIIWGSIQRLEEQLNKLEEQLENKEK